MSGVEGDVQPADVARDDKGGALDIEAVVSVQKDSTPILEPVPLDSQITCAFHQCSAYVPLLFAAPSIFDKLRRRASEADRSAKRQILHNIGGSCFPGQVLALMGPSGSGKTSLLSMLGGRQPRNMEVTGDVLFNGRALEKPVKRKIGYVLQDDLLFDSLTVYETLYFAAKLRLPNTWTLEQKLQRVEGVINSLGLEKCRDTLIGGPFMRGVSGGERKRVSVGHELLINPSAIMLDEPTSGLDSTSAMHLLSTLSDLAKGGRAVITTIHQPSSRLYQQLDKLLLLSDGHVMYYGQAQQVHEWFKHLGYPVPFGTNVADWILDLSSGEASLPEELKAAVANKDVETSTATYLIEAADRYLERRPTGFTELGSLGSMRLSWREPATAGSDLVTVELDAQEGELQRQQELKHSTGRLEGLAKWGALWMEQVSTLLVRSLKTRRFESLSSQKFVQLTVVAIITGLFWWQKGDDKTVSAALDVQGLLFFEMLLVAFGAMFAALFTFPNEFRLVVKERVSGMYRLSAYYTARTASDLPLDCLYPSVFVLIMYWMGGLRNEAGAFFANWWAIILIVLVAQSWGLLIGGAVMDPPTGQTITTILILTFMLVGGFYVRDIPNWISWVKYSSFVYWGFSLLTKIEFDDRSYLDCTQDADSVSPNVVRDPSAPADCFPGVLVDDIRDELGLPRDVSETPWVDASVLLGMLVALRVVIYYVLSAKTRS